MSQQPQLPAASQGEDLDGCLANPDEGSSYTRQQLESLPPEDDQNLNTLVAGFLQQTGEGPRESTPVVQGSEHSWSGAGAAAQQTAGDQNPEEAKVGASQQAPNATPNRSTQIPEIEMVDQT